MRGKLLLAGLWLLAGVASAVPQIAIVNADVFTADPAHPRARAIAIEGGRIAAVGTDAEIIARAGAATRRINAGGRLVTPGLTEAHVHLASNLPLFAQPATMARMTGLPFPGPTPEQALLAVRNAAAQPGDWVAGVIGPAVARDGRNWRDALDEAAGGRPVILRAFWGHTTLLNSAALARLGVPADPADPLGGWWGRDAAGRLDGRAYESAEWAGWERIAPPDADRLAAVFRQAAERYARWGVTSIHLINNGRSVPLTLEALARTGPAQKWTVYAWGGGLPDVPSAWAQMESLPAIPQRVRVDGPKWILDGTPIEQNARQWADYEGRPGWHGRSNYTDTQLREILSMALHSSHQLVLHVVGDAETDRLFTAMETLAPASEWVRKRVRLEHGDGIRRESLRRAVLLGVVVTQNPTHFPAARADGGPPRAVETMSMLRTLLRSGVPLALGSDAAGDETNPFLNMQLACSYSATGEALTREEALLAYTTGGAFAERQESMRGRLVPGAAADLAILSQNVLEVPAVTLNATRSLLTMIDGVVVYEDAGFAKVSP